MSLPAVAIATAFACGIALGLHPVVTRNASSPFFFFCSDSCSRPAARITLVRIGHLFFAAVASLLVWVLLGFLGLCIAEQPRDANHVILLLEQGRISRDESTRLPWGYGYEIELSGMEFEGTLHAVRGGLRLSFAEHPEGFTAPNLHAGEEVAVLAEAKRPQVFKDEGAFDRRTYLAQQNVDLVATLRAAELIERVG